VKREAGNDGIERLVSPEILEPLAPEDRTLGSPGIDGRDHVTGVAQGSRELSVAAANLQHATGPGYARLN
jgi:hypothetical protein